MREILFRAYDQELGLSEPFLLNYYPIWNGDTKPYWANLCKIEQFTGLHDATKWEDLTDAERDEWIKAGHTKEGWKGRRIFEGDVIHDEDSGAIGEVFFNNDGTGGYSTWFLGVGYNCALSVLDSTNLVIIGTIHDNPELVEA
jgi:hypothetical protein